MFSLTLKELVAHWPGAGGWNVIGAVVLLVSSIMVPPPLGADPTQRPKSVSKPPVMVHQGRVLHTRRNPPADLADTSEE